MTDASGQRCEPDENGMVVDPMSQRCGNCRWFDEHAYPYGRCTFQVILPRSISEHHFNHCIMGVHDGKDCPTWHAR